MHYLLAFSGSFLLSITFLHLLPETFRPVLSMEVNTRAGIYLLIGFFIQLLIQRFTHGVEHGHAHVHPHEHHIPLVPIIAGLTVHAFMEGLPLGFNYLAHGTEPSLYLAVGVHKLPEAMLVTSLVLAVKGKQKAWLALIYFSLITPVAAMLAQVLGQQYSFISQAVVVLIPIVAGAFIHIATTIFFESGTKQHMLSWQKISAMIVGVGLALGTLYFE